MPQKAISKVKCAYCSKEVGITYLRRHQLEKHADEIPESAKA